MIVDEGMTALNRTSPGCVVSVGNYDGLHLGHQRILFDARAARPADGELCVITFEPHPLTVLRPALAPPRLTTARTRQRMLEALGVDRLILLPPTQDVLNTSAESFYGTLRAARVAAMFEGIDFNFGKARAGNISLLRSWCARDGIALHVAPEISVTLTDRSIVPVSSSLIRWLIAHGRVRDAALCLGRPFSLEGVVVRGERRGRTIGFPTANLDVEPAPPLLAGGVYAGRCLIDARPVAVALSVGTKPTFAGTAVTVEAHLLDFAGDLYGQTLSIDVLDWLRGQEKYPSVDALVAQLHRDVARVRAIVA